MELSTSSNIFDTGIKEKDLEGEDMRRVALNEQEGKIRCLEERVEEVEEEIRKIKQALGIKENIKIKKSRINEEYGQGI